MPKDSNIAAVLVIGAGPIVIGQACEFDYSGTQACKALREEGVRVILVNSNPATIMTDPETADAVYIEPITPEMVEKIIVQEKPDALLTTVGGQTALNCGLALWKRGVLQRHGVRMIGASPEAIAKAEDRQLFNRAMEKIGLAVPVNTIASSLEQALGELGRIGLPAVIRPSYTLGGSGGGVAETLPEFKRMVDYGLEMSPVGQVQIDQSIKGWKEFELEVIRDSHDNAIIVCAIENVDPMGVHTGDSVTVAPALTLTDKEYQVMRNAALAVLREIGVETGGANVQFAVNPQDGQQVVIEMNPRVSRSSALASKATGFPIARVAAKLAIGYTLDEIQNDVAKTIPASFEPTIDYVVVKIPRFNFDKFPQCEPLLSSSMRSVGEVMAIGRSFAEALQKGLCSLEQGLSGLNAPVLKQGGGKQAMREELQRSTPQRLLLVAEGLRRGLGVEEINQLTGVDLWFLREVEKIVLMEGELQRQGLTQDRGALLRCKQMGFSDARLAQLTGATEHSVRSLRHRLGVRPVYKKVDTCAAEFESEACYLYSCYEGDEFNQPECEANPKPGKKVIVLGSGPNRIGQGVEFDYACVHALRGFAALGYEAIMVNCNPETVSTDYDISDKLYFEPLSEEHVLELIQREQQAGQLLGVAVQFGGQTPLRLARELERANIPILGTAPSSIDLAEDRERFCQLLLKLGLRQPASGICYRAQDIAASIREGVGFPLVVRPSHVLGGRGMAILRTPQDLERYLEQHRQLLVDGPILLDRFLDQAIEVDVDAICDGQEVYLAGIMEHIEPAGVHSGDSACVLPPFSLSAQLLAEIAQSVSSLARELGVVGLVNIQYAIQGRELFVLEANPRASRSVPFVAKATGVPVAMIASQVMAGRPLASFALPQEPKFLRYSVKEAVLPFARFPGADVVLGPEMKSTGEVMGQGESVFEAFAKAQLAVMGGWGERGLALVCYQHPTHSPCRKVQERLRELGFEVRLVQEVFAARGGNGCGEEGGGVAALRKLMRTGGRVKFVACTDQGPEFAGFRRLLATSCVPYFTTHEAVLMALESMERVNIDALGVERVRGMDFSWCR